MASGKKNYFRHSFNAFEDEKIQNIIEKLGYEGYAYYFILIELLAKQCEHEVKNPIRIHQQSLRIVWRKHAKSCIKVVEKLVESGLFVATFNESYIEFDIPNLAKYLGKYTNKNIPNTPNKRKENEIKEKKIKVYTFETEKELLDFWNYQKVKSHKCTDKKLLEIKKALIKKKEFKLEEIKQAILDYAEILNSDLAFFSYKWDLVSFLSRDNALKFYGENYDKASYFNSKTFKNNNDQSQASSVPIHIQRGFHRLNVTENPYKEQFYKDQDKNNE